VPIPSLISSTDTYDATGTVGPFLIGTFLYVILVESATGRIGCYESVDQGVMWVLVDDVGAPSTYATNNIGAASDGSLIYVTYDNAGRTENMISVFTPGTGWGSPVATGNVATTGDSNLYIFFRELDDNLIVAANIKTGVASNQSAFYTIDLSGPTTSGWILCGAASTASAPTRIFGLLEGAVGTTWILMNQTGSSSTDVAIQSIFGTSLSGIVTVASGALGTVNDAIFGFSDGVNIVITWNPIGTSNINVLVAPVGTMVFTSQNIVEPSGTTQFGAITSTILGVVVFVSGDGADNIVYFQDTGSGFGGATVVLTGDHAFDILGNTLGPTGWSIVFVDANGVEYLVGLPPTLAPSKLNLSFPGVIITPTGEGSMCRYGRKMRCIGNPPRFILTSKNLVYQKARA
jgi:hypothetical protein